MIGGALVLTWRQACGAPPPNRIETGQSAGLVRSAMTEDILPALAVIASLAFLAAITVILVLLNK